MAAGYAFHARKKAHSQNPKTGMFPGKTWKFLEKCAYPVHQSKILPRKQTFQP
jgi:hypothetical protein